MRLILVTAAVLLWSAAAFGQDCANGQCAVGSRPRVGDRIAGVFMSGDVAPRVAAIRQLQPVRTLLGFERRHDRRAARTMLVR